MYRTVRMDNGKPKLSRTKPKLNSCGSYFHQRIGSDQEGKKKKIFKIKESEREELNLFQRGNQFSKVDQFSLYTVSAEKNKT